MAERGVSLAHTTIIRWVQRCTPEFEKRWRRFAVAVVRSWCVDETYVKIDFQKFRHAATTIAGIELMHRIRKGQFGLRRLGVLGGAVPEVWNIVLGA